MGKARFLAWLGAIVGIIVSVIAFFVSPFGLIFNIIPVSLFWRAIVGFIFSVLGFIGGTLERNKLVGGALCIISAFAMLVLEGLGVVSFLLFLVAGILILITPSK